MTQDILALIEQEEQNAYGIHDSELSDARAEAIQYYLGERFGNEIEGRSQVVSTDTQDVIETALPQLLKVFVSGDKVVEFNPRGPEDVEAAEQETEYVNHLVMEKNHGFNIFYVWFKDALLSKNGYVKVWFERYEEQEEDFYQGLTDAQVNMLVQDRVEVLEHTAYPDPSFPAELAQQAAMMAEAGMPAPPVPQLHDIKISVTNTKGCIKIQNVAPEAIMVSTETPGVDLQEARFVQHRELMSLAEAKEMGFDVADDVWSEIEEFYQESEARNLYGEDQANVDTTDVLVRDTYYKLDGKRKRYVVIGNKIVLEQDEDIVPFACLSPILMPHRHIGRSYADMVKDIQLIKSALMRGMLDSTYLANSPRYAISDRVNLEDMLVSRPGGVVRTQGDPNGSILPLVSPAASPVSFSMVEYMDSAKEKRTGVTSYNQGLDANSLNKTATGISIITQASQERLLLVARLFAETGVKHLFTLVHRLVRKHQDKAEVVRLRNEWVEVDPRTWKNRADMSISVGIGTGNKDQQLQHLMTILQVQREGLAIGITDPEKIYNSVSKLSQNAGFKNPEEFWTNPSSQPPQQPQPSPEEIKLQGQMQMKQMDIQSEQQKFQAETQIEQQKAEQQLQQEMLRSQNDVAIEQERISAEMELERYKAQLSADVELQKMRMQIAAQQKIAMITAGQEGFTDIDNEGQEGPSNALQGLVDAINTNMQTMAQSQREMMEMMNRPKKVIRGKDGRVERVE